MIAQRNSGELKGWKVLKLEDAVMRPDDINLRFCLLT